MPYFISIQYPYQYLEIAISNNTQILTTESISKIAAVGMLIPTLEKMLQACQLSLDDISCIGVNVGPGPFNTLRSIIATANGIGFATKIKLVACNGLDLITKEQADTKAVIIMDAFGNDVYYAFTFNHEQGYASINDLVDRLNQEKIDEIYFIGNGVQKHKQYILQHFSGSALWKENCEFASLQKLVQTTVHNFNAGLTSEQIFPLYFASPVIKS